MSVLTVVPVGAYMTEHEETVPDPVRAHGDPVMVPVPLLVRETEPAGVPRPVLTAVSFTVMVQVITTPARTGFGLQETAVVVGSKPTPRLNMPELPL